MRRAFLLGLLLAGCSGPGPGGPIQAVPVPVVQVARPERREVVRTLELPGDARPYQEARLYAKVPGYLSRMLVDTGDRVLAGQLLAELEVPELERDLAQKEAEEAAAGAETAAARMQMERARAEVQGASAEVGRAQALLDQTRAELAQTRARLEVSVQTHERLRRIYDLDSGLLARQELDVALGRLREDQAAAQAAQQRVAAAHQALAVARTRTSVSSAEVEVTRSRARSRELQGQALGAAAARARQMQEYTQIRAPFAGLITDRYLHPGALVQTAVGSAQGQTQPVLALADLRRLRVTVHVPETEASFVSRGTSAHVQLAGQAESLPARVTRVSGRLDAATRTMLTELELDNRGLRVKAGALVRVELELERRARALSVPATAVVREKDKRFVWVVRSNKVEKLQVQVGFENPAWVEVREGLPDQEQVVVLGKEALTPGATVKVGAGAG